MAHKRKVGMLQGGVAFVHPEHGECVVLENGQWTFSVHGKKQKEAHVYFYVLSAELPEGARENPKTWDDTKGIAHERSAAVRALIARPLPRHTPTSGGRRGTAGWWECDVMMSS